MMSSSALISRVATARTPGYTSRPVILYLAQIHESDTRKAVRTLQGGCAIDKVPYFALLLRHEGIRSDHQAQATTDSRQPWKEEAAVFAKLVEDLRTSGPVQPLYPNYSALGKGKYHFHLSYHWVACWSNEKGKLEIEVYYVGSRESAPY